MLRILKLAANNNCETDLEFHILNLIQKNEMIKVETLESLFENSNPILPDITCNQHEIHSYDCLIQ